MQPPQQSPLHSQRLLALEAAAGAGAVQAAAAALVGLVAPAQENQPRPLRHRLQQRVLPRVQVGQQHVQREYELESQDQIVRVSASQSAAGQPPQPLRGRPAVAVAVVVVVVVVVVAVVAAAAVVVAVEPPLGVAVRGVAGAARERS